MNYYAKNGTMGNTYEGTIQVFKLFGSYGALSEDGRKSLVAFSHPSSEEVIAILKGRGFYLKELSEKRDEKGNLIVFINGNETHLNDNGDISSPED